jgi:hypothetical protein
LAFSSAVGDHQVVPVRDRFKHQSSNRQTIRWLFPLTGDSDLFAMQSNPVV